MDDISLLTDDDIYLFNEGNHLGLYEKFGAHCIESEGLKGTYFALWAPNARKVSVVGDFNGWDRSSHPLLPRDRSGIWEGFIPGVRNQMIYKYHIVSRLNSYSVDKADPFAFYSEAPPKTGSIVWGLDYVWGDDEWMEKRGNCNSPEAPISIYELHLGSWMRVPEEENRPLSYRELASRLPEYVKDLGFTHVEFLPVMEHPFYGSWGYQTIGYFTPSSRYGTPQDFMYLVDLLHQKGIGVILDWVPSHFPGDEHGLGYFDGSYLYEHSDAKQRIHPVWDSLIFNYGRNEVRSFLLNSALYWMDKYHTDGLRVDAVSSMLYLDYGRENGAWIPNWYGGRENLEAISLLRHLNEVIYMNYPDTITVAEESTAWPMVSRPNYAGGLGFGMKWDMGWMHDTLDYMSRDLVHRKNHHSKLTFRNTYSFHENFILPLSHDEVVYGKGSLLRQMPGDYWQKFANLRLLFGYMYAQPGKKLLFMGGEFGQWDEWYHESGLAWHLLDQPLHRGLKQWVKDLNQLYRTESALHELDFAPAGFEWIDCKDALQSTLSILRRANPEDGVVAVVLNFTPVTRYNYRVGVPVDGFWKEILNSDTQDYGGSGHGNLGGVMASPVSAHGRPYSLNLTLPPLAAVYFKSRGFSQEMMAEYGPEEEISVKPGQNQFSS